MRRLVSVVLALITVLGLAGQALADAPSQRFPATGFTVADTASARFLTAFNQLGGVEALGYPVSQPFSRGGFTHQAFQRGVLQWRPEQDQAVLANVLDWFSEAGQEGVLAAQGIPAAQADHAGGDFARAVAERESWLTDPAIAQAYRLGGGFARFGLPASAPVAAGPFVVQRFQRYVFQHWTADVAGMPAKGSVVGVLVGDLLKTAGIVPASAAIADQTPTAPAAPVAAATDEAATFEAAILAAINDVRQERGLAPLVSDERLHVVAHAHAGEMVARGYFGLTNPDGLSWRERLARAGVGGWTWAVVHTFDYAPRAFVGPVKLVADGVRRETANEARQGKVISGFYMTKAARAGVGVAIGNGKVYLAVYQAD